MKYLLLGLWLILSSCAPKNSVEEVLEAAASPPVPALAEGASLQEQSFFYVWDRIRVSYPYEDMRGIDWGQAYFDLLSQAREAQSAEELRPVLESLLGRLGESHFVVHPGKSYRVMQEGEQEERRDRSGELGFDLRLIEGRCLVVRIEAGSSAEVAGLHLGDQLLDVGDHNVAEWIQELRESGAKEEMLPHVVRRKILREMQGPPGSEVEIHYQRLEQPSARVAMARQTPSSTKVQFGNLPSLEVVFEEETLESEAGRRVGYVYFNIFLGDVVTRFSKSMASFVEAGVDGMIIDLRGNPGGLGAMSRGVAGHFVFDSKQSLGAMKTRDSELSFYVVPKAPSQRFEGPLAILVDDQTGSTSEILAGGLQDLGRATIVGTTSAGMALPSVIETMPNGDAIQFAMGDLVTAGGYRIEGQGVRPDVEVVLSAESLAGGEDPVVREAMNWIDTELISDKEVIP
jgi:carboxyl-terminal processing protease